MNYPKRLIEVDLPIKRISEHARREKSIRHGHISTLHIWWARRPLAACRAVICAALWPDPADPLCPQKFRDDGARLINEFARTAVADKDFAHHCSAENWTKWQTLMKNGGLDSANEGHWNILRNALLDFIADFANWDNSTVKEYLETSRSLTQSAHESLGGEPGTKPLVVDPFAGGGSIPLEALRVGADAFASDLNPVAVLLNKVVLEYIPKYGQRLADEVRKWGTWIKEEAEKELAEFYPKDSDGATPIAYLWARTITCEGPGCGAQVPLVRSLWLARKSDRSVALQLVPSRSSRCVNFQIIVKRAGRWVHQDESSKEVADPKFDGTVKRGSVACPCCGFTTAIESVRRQLKARHGGAKDSRMLCVVTTRNGEIGRSYRLPSERDSKAAAAARTAIDHLMMPTEVVPVTGLRRLSVPVYGMTAFSDFYTDRQTALLSRVFQLIRKVGPLEEHAGVDPGLLDATTVILALVGDKLVDFFNSLTRWKPDAECPVQLFARQAVPIVWDFVEPSPFSGASGSWDSQLERTLYAMSLIGDIPPEGTVQRATATHVPLPDSSVAACVTDPPYYDAIVYAHLADVFYVWLKRCLAPGFREFFTSELCPKEEEIVVDPPHSLSPSKKDAAHYERMMAQAMAEARRIVRPSGVAIVVFAHKTTSGWEAILEAMLSAGWCITSSWPLDTEMANKVAAIGQARLMSSIHLACRPRRNPDHSSPADSIGDWRDVLGELPKRIHEWMPRLSSEGVVGADAIFACLGPALEIFSRYDRVEKASGEQVTLKEYLEYVWAAVAKEALNMIFAGADATGLEEDARLTAMWLWTLSTTRNGDRAESGETEDEEEGEAGKKPKVKDYSLEYDAARKIAQGLGAHLERLEHLIEVKGDTARMLPVAERARYLFGKDDTAAPTARRRKPKQLALGDILQASEQQELGWGDGAAPKAGSTVLDRVHQSMLLFQAGRSEALKRFLVDGGAGQDQRFWRLAQALSALYPGTSDEKRWVDGVLARKKGLGL